MSDNMVIYMRSIHSTEARGIFHLRINEGGSIKMVYVR